MAEFISAAEAAETSTYTHEYIRALVRNGKVKGRKSGKVWSVDLEDLKAYEKRMLELGPHKFDPVKSDLPT